jgi:hypothetical protein
VVSPGGWLAGERGSDRRLNRRCWLHSPEIRPTEMRPTEMRSVASHRWDALHRPPGQVAGWHGESKKKTEKTRATAKNGGWQVIRAHSRRCRFRIQNHRARSQNILDLKSNPETSSHQETPAVIRHSGRHFGHHLRRILARNFTGSEGGSRGMIAVRLPRSPLRHQGQCP